MASLQQMRPVHRVHLGAQRGFVPLRRPSAWRAHLRRMPPMAVAANAPPSKSSKSS